MPGKLKKIVIHWTAGAYGNLERDHYHYVIDHRGAVHSGTKPPESNIPKNGESLSPQPTGTYVPHCGGGNSFAIGVSLVGMGLYAGRSKPGKYPLTAIQCEKAWEFIASLCEKYNIPITPETVFTHYEFGKKNPRTASAGKIDITFLPHKPNLKPDEIGDYIRQKIKWYYTNK